MRFYLAQRKDAALVDVFVRAQIQIQEGGDQRRYNDFLGKDARTFTNLSAKIGALREHVLEHCKKSDLGEHVHVQAFEDDGVFVFNVLRSHHTRKPLAVVPGRRLEQLSSIDRCMPIFFATRRRSAVYASRHAQRLWSISTAGRSERSCSVTKHSSMETPCAALT